MERVERFCYKWLPIFFGCHCRADRSFFFRGKQFPVCARCTGIMCGMIIFLISCWFFRPMYRIAAVMAVPLIIDGALQKRTSYESTNIRRLITGVLFGYAICWLIIGFLHSGFRSGIRLGEYLLRTL